MKEEKKAQSIKLNSLSAKIIDIQMGKDDVNTFIADYIPYIKSCAYKACGKYINRESDEMSVALMAFHEAINSYDNRKGSFLSFANWVIKRRIIDYMRKENRIISETNFSDLSQHQLNHVYDYEAGDDYLVENPLKLEIDALSNRLHSCNIQFEELVLVSPKSRKTKHACIGAIKYIVDNPIIYKEMQNNCRLPIKKIAENLKIPRKLLERHRKYIMTVVEILTGDYLYLREYVAFIEKGEH